MKGLTRRTLTVTNDQVGDGRLKIGDFRSSSDEPKLSAVPSGLVEQATGFPALKRRAILRMSLRDKAVADFFGRGTIAGPDLECGQLSGATVPGFLDWRGSCSRTRQSWSPLGHVFTLCICGRHVLGTSLGWNDGKRARPAQGNFVGGLLGIAERIGRDVRTDGEIVHTRCLHSRSCRAA
jgi:hypothetical protein